MAAIGHGGWLLCPAGIVEGRKATCFTAVRDDMIHAGARYVDEEVAVASRSVLKSNLFCRREELRCAGL